MIPYWFPLLGESLHPKGASDDDKRRATARVTAMKAANAHKLYDGWK